MLERLGQLFRGNEPVAIAVELAVIWLAVFLVLRFLRGTRGAGVLKGVIVVLAAIILSLRFAGSGADTFARLRFVAGPEAAEGSQAARASLGTGTGTGPLKKGPGSTPDLTC